jgi:exopolysaccharide biosynthesis polyprenyl glycosylphosphotransferase
LYVFHLGKQINPNAQIETYFAVLGYIIVLWLLAFILSGMYRSYSGPLARIQEFSSIVKGVVFGTLEVMAFTFMYKTFPESRYVLVYAAIVAIVLIVFCRSFLAVLQNHLHRYGLGNRRALIIGNDLQAQRIGERILKYPELGYNLIGFVFSRKPQHVIHPLKNKLNRLGGFSQLKHLIKTHQISSLFVADPDVSQEKIYALSRYCHQEGLEVRFVSTQYQRNLNFTMLDTLPLLEIRPVRFGWKKRIQKRILDLSIALPLLCIALPIMGLIALLIKSTSAGPVIYSQRRMTIDNGEFDLYKFRSMLHNVEQGSPVLSTADQKHRTTSIGYFLRKTSLDELPQLFNVIKGEMSLVGPRPERPFFHQKYKKEIPHWDDRLLVPGGITGWAQLNGRAELTALPFEKLEYDLYYVENWSVLFDILILIKTFGYVVLQRDVY